MKEKIKGLCGNCNNLTKRTVETHMDLYSYKSNGQAYNREYACTKGHTVWAHQVTAKCSSYRQSKRKSQLGSVKQ